MKARARTSWCSVRGAALLIARVLLSVLIIGVAPVSANAENLPLSARRIDQFGMDLVLGRLMRVDTPVLTIGQADSGGLTYTRLIEYYVNYQHWQLARYVGAIEVPPANGAVTVGLGADTRLFTPDGSGNFTPQTADGATLTFNSGNGQYTYTTREGVRVVYSNAVLPEPQATTLFGLVEVQFPSGELHTYHYRAVGSGYHRLQSITNNFGYQLKFEYAAGAYNGVYDVAQFMAVFAPTKVTGINNGIDYCNPTADTCGGLTQSWPSLSYAYNTAHQLTTITDNLSRITQLGYSGPQSTVTSIRYPGSVVDDLTYGGIPGSPPSNTVTDGAGTWTYTINAVGTPGNYTFYLHVTDPLSHTWRYRQAGWNFVDRDIDPANNFTDYQFDANNRLTQVIYPELNRTEFTYDARGNLTLTRHVAKPGSGLVDITSAATYSATCSNPVICNQPTSSTDERGFVTDYTYNATHGGILTVTEPAPTAGGVRPQLRTTYTQRYARYKNSSGTVVQAPTPVYRVSQLSSCSVTASCNNAVTESRTTITHGSGSGANNLLPTVVTRASGSGSITSTDTMTYTVAGDVMTIDGPLSGTADLTRFRYDAARQLIGVIGPDPDGASALKHRAERTSYDLAGRILSVEQGTVNSQSDPDWAAFAPLASTVFAYNSQGRPIRVSSTAAGTTHAVSQYSYLADGRVDCIAQRMNAGVFGSLPAACSQSTQGANGPDRITRYTYDAFRRVTEITEGFDTGVQQAAFRAGYTNNSARAWILDANNNRTDYIYDGFDRVSRVNYPSATLGAGSANPADYEQYTYDAGGNILSVRRRNGQSFAYTFDNLSRQTLANAPGSDPDVSFTYDNYGNMLTATSGAHALSWAYDALSRVTSHTAPQGTVSYQYDAASRRTRTTWPGSFYVTYSYDLADAITAVRENGAASGIGVLATYAYDNLGRRTTITRGNGTSSAYTYGASLQLATLSQDVTGSAADLTISVTRNALQLEGTRNLSNDAYAWPHGGTWSQSYIRNGLNQYTAVGGLPTTHDALGNTTGVAGATFGYDNRSRLVSASGGGALSYDPVDRLYQATGTSGSVRFLYDGDTIIAEYSTTGTLLRRFVHGPGIDEPIVWYEGTGTTDRRWLHADERGSVMAVSNASGTVTAQNSYDAFGRHGASNTGRFQFTGQAYLPEVGAYHYRARAYLPLIGRFLQTDPIAYAGGMNLYTYVGNDPINLVDPSGLQVFDPEGCAGTPWTCTMLDDLWVDLPGIRVDASFFDNLGRDNIGQSPTSGGGGGAGGQQQLVGAANADRWCPVVDVRMSAGAQAGLGFNLVDPRTALGGGGELHADYLSTGLQLDLVRGNVDYFIHRGVTIEGQVHWGALRLVRGGEYGATYVADRNGRGPLPNQPNRLQVTPAAPFVGLGGSAFAFFGVAARAGYERRSEC